jgi:hypothetical protein
MKRTLMVAALTLAIAPVASAQNREITLRGCVTPGVDKGTYVLTHVDEVTAPGKSAMPAEAHGRRVVFWLDHDNDVKKQMGQSVEVRGKFDKFEESEIEVKAGPAKEGGLFVEFEGPGKDVTVSQAAIGNAVGTSGSTAENHDVKTFLLRVKVDSVRAMGACQ